MKRDLKKIILLSMLFCVILFGKLAAQENFASPVVIGELVGVYECSNLYTDSRNSCGYANDVGLLGADVVYSFTLSQDATVEMSMCGSSFDTFMSFYDVGLSEITSNDNYCGNSSFISRNLVAGTYYIVCEGFSSACGDYNLSVRAILHTILVPDLPLLPDISGECFVDLVIPTAKDNCSGTIYGVSGILMPITSTQIVTWTFDDGFGNVLTQTQNIIIEDSIGPVPDLASLPDINAECQVGFLTPPSATDNCAISSTNLLITSPAIIAGNYIFGYSDFGPQSFDITGQCVLVNDDIDPSNNGCEPIINNIVGKIAIIYRGACSFSIKVINAQNAGAIGVIIINNQPAVISNMGGTDPAITIPAMMMMQADGDALINQLTLGETVIANLKKASLIVTNNATLPITTQGTTVITWTYDDGNGNISSQTQNVVITDVTAPVPDIADLVEIVECLELTDLIIPTALDNCMGSISGTYDVTLPITESTTVIWTYDDGDGNISNQNQSIIINSVDASVTNNSPILIANALGATYRWLDCDNSYNPVEDAVSQTFLALVNGNYAVEVTFNGCTKISDCYNVTNVGIANQVLSYNVFVYPNPTNGLISIEMPETGKTLWRLLDVTGKIVIEGNTFNQLFLIDLEDYTSGIYLLNLTQGDNNFNLRLVRK